MAVSGFVIVLNEDLPDDEAKNVLDAIRMIRGISDVKPAKGNVSIPRLIAETRVRHELATKLVDMAKTISSHGTVDGA